MTDYCDGIDFLP